MAYFRKRNGKWKVEINKPNFPRLSKTFLDKATARKFKEHNEDMADKKDARILEEKQKKAFEDPFMLSEKQAYKKRHDEWLIEKDRIECGDYNRKEIETDYY